MDDNIWRKMVTMFAEVNHLSDVELQQILLAGQKDLTWYNRLAEYRDCIDALAKITTVSANARIRRGVIVAYELGEARRVIFQDTPPRAVHMPIPIDPSDVVVESLSPPFVDLTEAWSWIEAELSSEQAKEFRAQLARPLGLALHQHAAVDRHVTGSIPWAMDNPMLGRIRGRAPFYYPGIEAEAAMFWLKRERELEYIAPGYEVAYKEGPSQLLGLRALGEQRQVGEEEVECVTEKLALLSVWGGWMSAQTDYAWRRADCARYILTGEIPPLPHLRVRNGWAGVVIEVYTAFTSDLARELHHKVTSLRKARRSPRKSYSDQDRILIDFVERVTAGKSSAQRLIAWEKLYPDDHISRPGLASRYEPAKKRQAAFEKEINDNQQEQESIT